MYNFKRLGICSPTETIVFHRSVSALEASSERFLSGFESFVVALLAMVIATFSTGIDSQCFRFKKDVCSEGEEEDGVPYGCGFFHFVFATVAMQLIGWNTHHPMIKQIFFNILIHTSVSTGLRLLLVIQLTKRDDFVYPGTDHPFRKRITSFLTQGLEKETVNHICYYNETIDNKSQINVKCDCFLNVLMYSLFI
ncbi:hypothetical protein HID58_025258 [Brassica napus]|uniref:CASP-like protein n=1 Tax=Brassica napus TaxID=3708 RepID=A0ABQ8CKQ1_BRANA|nr:hypothetical protein HID58_025258 [Brassica napus]